MLGRLGQFDGVVGNAIMLPLWFELIAQIGCSIGAECPRRIIPHRAPPYEKSDLRDMN